jgi:hypothetical protein
MQFDRGRERPWAGDLDLEGPGIPVIGGGELVEVLGPQRRGATSVAALGDKAALFRRVADALEVELARLPAPVLCRPGLPSAAIVAAHELRGGWWQTFTSPDDEASLRITRWVVRNGVVTKFSATAPGAAVPKPQSMVGLILMPQAERETMLAEELRRLSGWVPVGEVAWCRPCADNGRPMPWPEND